jgi:hypothetical protein
MTTCSACGATFRSASAFDMHRVGVFSTKERKNTRHCLTAKQMETLGMARADKGRGRLMGVAQHLREFVVTAAREWREEKRYLAQFGGVDPEEILESVRSEQYPPVQVGIILHAGEVPLFSAQATLSEDRTTQRLGSSLGYSFPVGHHTRFRVGSYRGQTISTSALTRADTGTLANTSQRVVFNGGCGTLSMPAQKIVNTVIYRNGVDVRVENRQKREVFMCANPLLVNTYVLTACQLVHG